ncbi:uncharacterized protein LOC114252614 [Bombyx mandarina]|nr:uncharacterized protein LOC114252614 [Bombyx mandarina]
MHTHGNLTASYLWQPGEFARRMLGERPSPVPPTRDLWPPPQQPLSISTLQISYLQDEPEIRRSATLPAQSGYATKEDDRHRPQMCTIGTNTDPPPNMLERLRILFKRQENETINHHRAGQFTIAPRETSFEVKEESSASKKLSRIKKALANAKYKIAPRSETIESPKIVYDTSKPGDRMKTTFGVRDNRRICKMPSRSECLRRLRTVSDWCRPRSRRPPRRQPPVPRLQITQV